MILATEPKMNLNPETMLIIQQLQLFSYSHSAIMQAMVNVIDKTDIIEIMDYIDNKCHLLSPGVNAVVDDVEEESEFEDLYMTKDERISEVLLLTQRSVSDEYIYLHSNIWNEPVYNSHNDQRMRILQILDELNDCSEQFDSDSSDDDLDDLYLTKSIRIYQYAQAAAAALNGIITYSE